MGYFAIASKRDSDPAPLESRVLIADADIDRISVAYAQLYFPNGVPVPEVPGTPEVPATYDEEGNELTPAVIVGGHHVNLRAYGEFAEQVTYGLPQEGDVFERTHILQIIQDLDFKPITEEGVPAGYEGPNGVRLFDPGVINRRARVWA